MDNRSVLNPRPSLLDRETFVATYGDVYEHSPWIAAQTHDAGLDAQCDTPQGLATRLAETFNRCSAEQQLAVVRAHPDLAGKAAMQGALTADSTSEQAGAGLDQCTAEEFERFQRFNQAYTERFGFPFVMAVRGSNRHQILAAFDVRLNNDADTELATAVEQVNRIALLRLEARLAGQ